MRKAKVAFFAVAMAMVSAVGAQAQSDVRANNDMQAVSGTAAYPVGLITGSITNVTDRSFQYVTVEFNLYDDSGMLVGNAIAAASNLGPGETFKYKADTTTPFVKYKLAKITSL